MSARRLHRWLGLGFGLWFALAGLSGAVLVFWREIEAVRFRTGTPQPAIDKLNRAINQALAKPDLQEKLRRIGAQPMPGSPAEWGQFITAERERWIPVAKRLDIKAE